MAATLDFTPAVFQSTRPHGARPAARSCGRSAACFNPRARMGRDACRHAACPRPGCFNPRARMGRDGMCLGGGKDKESFNPRARMGRDWATSSHDPPRVRFQSTRPHGARHAQHVGRRWIARFQSTRPHGARLDHAVARPQVLVSIHAPAWGATAPGGPPRARPRCFNPRARMGRDRRPIPPGPAQGVSIHAPAWGATPPEHRRARRRSVSIHAPAWGATRAPGRASGPHCFNPRARMGRDTRIRTC